MASPLRLAAQHDVPLATELMREFYAESGYRLDADRAAAALAALAAEPALGRLWLIEDAREPVGYVALCFGWSLEYHGRDAFVDDLYLRPAARGKGLGSRALEAVAAESVALGVHALHLEVERVNAPAQALYRKLGFRDNERQLLTRRLDG